MFVCIYPLTPSDPVRATRILGVEDRRPRQDRHARLQLLDLDLELGLEHLEGLDLLGRGFFFRGGCLAPDAGFRFLDRVSSVLFVVFDDLLVPLVISLMTPLRSLMQSSDNNWCELAAAPGQESTRARVQWSFYCQRRN